nr:uncharacterized protein LOC116769414 isoform X5 [Danaus plexippus plexippus]
MNSQIECSRPLKRKDIGVKTRSNILNRTRVEVGSYQRNKISLLKEDKFIPNTYRPISSVKNKVEGLTEIDNHDSKSVKQQFDFFAVNRNNKKEGVKTKLCSESNKVDVSSQYARRPKSPSYIKTFDGSRWQNIDNTFELEQYLEAEKEDAFTSNKNSSKKIRISEMPRVKIIAEKLPKKNNVKSRKLEEQIVCLEYDVFTSDHHYAKPSQTMKAYFSVKPIGRDEENIPMLPTSRKRYFNVANEDFDTLNETDVDIIDAKVAKNKSYLDILENILIRKQKIYTNEKKSTLDLMSLYQMAKSDIPLFDKNFSNRY